jgi:DEAD/DEAH box helicase domain-containing protein
MLAKYFSNLLPELSTRAARATISKLGFSNPPLRRHLFEVFARGYGEPGCFLGDPVFEATFGWTQANTSFGALAKTLIHPKLVDAMDKPWGESGKEYQFPRAGRPYTHQLEAWKALLGSGFQSVVVTSGTGSGKTECFMVPVLSSIATELDKQENIEGIRALFLYPLNALIQSQRERLRAWTGPFGGDVRFCLYNGMTPEEAKAELYREAPNEVHDRVTLRKSPPQILVTNPTMLEYMLVRALDAPILEKSQGKLEWIVLDEAHNYIGSQAAELALLLRRVLHAFGTSAERVRFVATSATIGSGDSSGKKQLQEFLAKLAGVSSDRVVVVEGQRHVPDVIERVDLSTENMTLDALAGEKNDSEGCYQRLSVHPVARKLRDLFVPALSKRGFQPLSEIKKLLQTVHVRHDDEAALAWMDLLTSAEFGNGRTTSAFLPLRLHAFHNTFNGLWACASPSCPAKASTQLAHDDWGFGLVYTEERHRCACGAPVYPLTSCNDCNETFLSADLVISGGVRKLVSPLLQEVDEFMLDRDQEEHDFESEELAFDEAVIDLGARSPALVISGSSRGASIFLDPQTCDLLNKPVDTALNLRVQDVSFEDKQQVLKCPCCDGAEAQSVQFRKPMLGAPFLLGSVIPTMLEFCPDGDHPLDVPMRGRRMITFTDSRQGTARIAAQLQQDAERTAVRAGVYRKLVTSTAGSSGERAAIENKIAEFNKLLAMVKGTPAATSVEGLLNAEKAALQKLTGGKAVPFQELVQWLASQSQDVGRWIHAYYAESDSLFRAPRGRELLTEILLCREFSRRPKRQNSLETMGLASVQYPKLTNVQVRRAAVEQAGFTLSEWHDFLKLCLDFFIRQRWCLKLPSSWERWGGNKVYSKQVLPPKSKERTTSRLVRWPMVLPGSRQNGLVRLLAYVLKVDPHSDSGKDRIDSLLLAAWEDLTMSANLLQLGGGQGRYLDLDDMSFQNISKAWVCPVTRRVLDTTLRGVTPYLPAKQIHEGVARCRPIEMPVCDVIAHDYPNDDARVAAARDWVDRQEILVEARVEGLWSSISDRVIEAAGYFRVVEHSAQQAGSRLKQYEAQFKRGAINLMSCSTTMEMGVDIGGINMVAMNNVPPHPANYLQRAGRAGRRSETRSVALTVCKNNPHDQHVFSHTTWPFETRLPIPGIFLSSPILVQRHINALVLSKFLRLQDRQGKLDKLTLEWWMLPRDGNSRQERFVSWCECFDPVKQTGICDGLGALVKRTVFEGRSTLTALVGEVGRLTAEHAQQWLLELNAIDAQIDELSKRSEEDQIPLRALLIQRKRLTGEYLLRELATSGFLPGYGFPTDITSFETLNKDSAEIGKNREKSDSGREDNRFQRRELPSRDTVTALREYAPGASVVIDGLVYESAGITLNWHAPATLDQVSELQNIRQAWRCNHCGASGTHVLAAQMEHCQECGSALAKNARSFKPYLEPAGFSVDLYEATHNDITRQKYIPVEPPWIAGNGEWMPMANPILGRFRASNEGSVFHYSSGIGGAGYAVCLECGRAAPMGYREDPDEMPAIFKKPHKRLRGRRGDGDDWNCGGSDNPFKIKRPLCFGREYTTDVLELTLYGTDGNPLNNSTVAFTLAVALRRAVAERLGIEETELGCDSKEVRDFGGRRVRSLQIFDVRSAGYSTLVAPYLPTLLTRAREILICDHDCDSACQNCLLNFDTRFRVDSLDRQAGLQFLTQEWVDSLALPDSECLFGSTSQAEYQPFDEAITRELNGSGAKHLYVYLNGTCSEWDLPTSPLKALLHRLSVKSDVDLCFVVSQSDLTDLSAQNAAVLESLRTVCNVELKAGTAPRLQRPGYCIASVTMQDGTCRSWAVQDESTVLPDRNWGQPVERPVVVSASDSPKVSEQIVRLPNPVAGGGRTIEVTRQLDGSGSGFGQRFWKLLGNGSISNALPVGKFVASVDYEDRYLATPLACAILVEIISSLKSYFEHIDAWESPNIRVTTMIVDRDKFPRHKDQWSSDWPSSELRDAAVGSAFDYCGMPAVIRSLPKFELIHGRRLLVSFTDGSQLCVVPDQGFSYWRLARSQSRSPLASFSMDQSPDLQGQQLAEIKVGIEGNDLPTLVSTDRVFGDS